MYLATWHLLFLTFLSFEINCQMSPQRELFHESNIGLVHQIKNPILNLLILTIFDLCYDLFKMYFHLRIKINLQYANLPLLGGFQLEIVNISLVLNHMPCYKFECSHWLKLQYLDWRENFV